MRQLAQLAALFVLMPIEVHAQEPIHLHPENPRYFQWRGQTTVLLTSGEHYGMVLNPDLDYIRYLDTLARDGLNYTRVFTGSYVEAPGAFGIARNNLAPRPDRFLAPWARSDVPGYPGGGNKFDLDHFNPEYFARLTNFVAEAAKRGIVVEVTLFSSIYGEAQWNINPFHPNNNINALDVQDFRSVHTLENGPILKYQQAMVRAIVRALNAAGNVIFEIQNEPWSDNHTIGEIINPYLLDKTTFPNAVQITTPRSIAWQSRVASWIRDEEKNLPNRHLIAQNIANFRLSVRTEDLAEYAHILNFHYAHPEAVLWNKQSGPIGCDETGFQGRDDARYRSDAWKFLLAGGALYNNLDYSFSPGHDDGTDTEPNGQGGGSPTLRRQLGILRNFLTQLDLVRMKPDCRALGSTPGVSAIGLSEPGRQYAFFFQGRGPIVSALHNLPEGRYRVQWVDPVKGPIGEPTSHQHLGPVFPLMSPEFDDAIAVSVLRVNPERASTTRQIQTGPAKTYGFEPPAHAPIIDQPIHGCSSPAFRSRVSFPRFSRSLTP